MPSLLQAVHQAEEALCSAAQPQPRVWFQLHISGEPENHFWGIKWFSTTIHIKPAGVVGVFWLHSCVCPLPSLTVPQALETAATAS